MKVKPWKNYVFWIVFTEAVGFISGLITRDGTELYKYSVVKPPLSPPAIVFPIAWVILYALMGIGMARVSLTSPSAKRRSATYIYLFQLALNFFWSIIFFNAEAYAVAFFWLLALLGAIILMTVSFNKLDRTAALLQIPYVIWVAFAGYLNLGVWLLNR